MNHINKIVLENLNFSYGNNNVFRNSINAQFCSDRIYLLKGKNGAGKSTLCKLLTRLYENYSGKIYFNDIDQRDLSREELLDEIAVVFQATPVFYDSIIDNLLLGRKTKKLEKLLSLFGLEKDLKEAGREFTDILSDENSLSGGQIQKLGIIRVLLSDKSIYIFDEPTSNLDVDSKKVFYDILNQLKSNHMIFLISHEENIEKYVDEVFILDKR